MKRFVSLFAALLMFSTLFLGVTPVHAKWVNEEVGWRVSYQGPTATATNIVVRDTAFTVLAANQSDTTATFSINGAAVWRAHEGLATLVDTAVVAYLVLQQDSSVVTANNIQNWAIEIDGRMGGFGPVTTLAQWTQVDSFRVRQHTTPTPAAAVIPLRAVHGVGALEGDSENTVNLWYKLMAFNELRVRVIPITTAGLMNGSVRSFIRYWVP